jgi:hypothetical protein
MFSYLVIFNFYSHIVIDMMTQMILITTQTKTIEVFLLELGIYTFYQTLPGKGQSVVQRTRDQGSAR